MATKKQGPTEIDKTKPPGGLAEAQLDAELMADGRWTADQISLCTWKDKIEMVTRLRAEEAERDNPLLVCDPDTADYVFDGHAGASPSAAERWMHCTASVRASREFLETLTPNQRIEFARSGTAARQGTTAHAAAETEARVVLGTLTAEEAQHTLLELTVVPEDEGEAYDEEMAEYITEYVDLVKQYHDAGRKVLIEQRVSAVVPLDGLHEGEVYEVNGSGDFIALPGKTAGERDLVVGDLKYGHLDVGVEENPQVRYYALGALGLLVDDEGNLTTDIEHVTYYIAQPRSGGIKTWTESLDDLLAWRDEHATPKLTLALYPDEGATFAPSEEACQWCPNRGGCAALAEVRIAEAADLFDEVVEAEFTDGPGAFPETGTLTDERLGELLTQITGLKNIMDDLKAEAQRRLFRGQHLPGWQLVNYTPRRSWDSEAEAALHPDNTDGLPEGLWSRKLVTPKAATDLLDASGADEATVALVTGLIIKPGVRPVIAPVGDRRKTWEGRAPEEMFPDLPDTPTHETGEG